MKLLPESDEAVAAAELVLSGDQKGGVILAPTETVYGLICAYDDTSARQRIYSLKHRPAEKLLAAFLPDISFVDRFAPPLSGAALKIARHFMPGPVTLVLPDGHGSTFGFRIPDHPFILSLLKRIRMPLASTSANLSGFPPALDVPGALASLDGEPDLAVDGGAIPAGSRASTVILAESTGQWRILREGPVTELMIRSVVDSTDDDGRAVQ